jgi:hypothetical protein
MSDKRENKRSKLHWQLSGIFSIQVTFNEYGIYFLINLNCLAALVNNEIKLTHPMHIHSAALFTLNAMDSQEKKI